MDDARAKRLRWHCRRGMRELDILLEPWFERRASAMSAAELDAFERFLGANDMDLYYWLTGRADPSDAAFADLVRQIRPLRG